MPLLTYDNALGLTLRQRFSWGNESVPLPRCTGRVLSRDVTAGRPLPPFDRVTLDGVAIRYADVAAGHTTFRSAGVHAAGSAPVALPAEAGACYEVMTGSVLPKGATTVVKVEDLRREEGAFVLPADVRDGVGIHRRGSDGGAGDVLLDGGHVIAPASLGVLASCGLAEVPVRRLPRAAIVSTGDELVEVGATPELHQIRRSNDYVVAGLLATIGMAADRFHLTDDKVRLSAELAELLQDYELLILSGGVSRGKFDYVPKTLESLGVERLLHRVAQRPGKPLWVGRSERTMVFGLPGNPVSTLACTLGYVGPWLRANLGIAEPPARYARIDADLAFAPDLRLMKTVRATGNEDGRTLVTAVGGGSGDYAGAARATGFLVLPQGEAGFTAGRDYLYLPHHTLLY